tara:strand:- start:631 stop:1071 length:441 start_codon:yes stop_codon:yes gene_type:complete
MSVVPTDNQLKEIPAAVWQALTHHVNGESWGKAAELAGIDLRTLKKYRQLPECIKFHNDQGRESAIVGRNVAFTAFPKVMSRLVKTALDNSERAYARNDASKTIINYVLEKEKMELYGAKMELLENRVAAMEGSKIIYDIEPTNEN